ncbi:MAG: lipoate--protein ligase family protein [Candidatus Zixiibacteriota bacterium]|nr:MAG: lipoate--protein ligase family protein [candidate division Zixibacteria bacterium]
MRESGIWRIISTGAKDAFFNMALDEALLHSCQNGWSPPVLRLYLWSPPAVSLGYSQRTSKTVDLKRCRDRGIQVVRRITGGRAVLHQDEITYSVCASTDDFPQLGHNTLQTYQKISTALLESLRFLGVEGEWVKPPSNHNPSSRHPGQSKPCFASSSRYEITVGGRKLIGSAQRRFSLPSVQGTRRSFIQHGSILTGKGEQSLAELLPGDLAVEKMRRTLENSATDLEQIVKRRIEPKEMASALKMGFAKVFASRMEDSEVSSEELEAASTLKEKKYLRDEWNLLR